MRGNAMDAECKLWQRLCAGQLNGLKFRRQPPIPPYIVDFFCGGAGLAIELDGSQHGDEADAARTRYLESKGLRVLRFRDNDVLLNTDAVLEAMLNAVGDRTLTPPPLPAGEGL